MQSNNKKFIIGGGISGMVWKYYHPDFHVISPDIGGMYARTNMVWLHDTAETRKLLTDLKIPIVPKRSYMGFYCNGWISDIQTEWLNDQILQRKMTPWNEKVEKKFKPDTRELSMSKIGGNNYMNTLNVDLPEIIRRISADSNVENAFVTKIDKDTITVKDQKTGIEEVRPYDVVVSTMAAPLFWKSYGDENRYTFKSMPITNVIVDVPPIEVDELYEMVYYTGDLPFSRISHIGNKYAIEFTGVITQNEFEKMYPNSKVLDYFVVKYGRIWENENTPPTDNIVFSGRFAQWKHKIVTEHIISQSINYNASQS